MQTARPTLACNRPTRLALCAALAGVVLGMLAGGAHAAGPLADPTRPPAAWSAGNAAPSAGKPRQAPLPVALPTPLPPLPLLPLLQSVHVPGQGAALALVDGQPVRAGDTLAGRLVLAIDRQGLTLQGREGTERLLLLEGSPKQAAGSIQGSRSASYVPATPDGSSLPQMDTAPRDARTATADQAKATQARPVTPGPLSLAGKTSP